MKRVFDILTSIIILLVTLPGLFIAALLVRVKLGSPIMFTQLRPGLDEREFKLYKFRSMTNEKNKDGDLLPNNLRLTPFGKLLRSTSLDELPSLFNVVKGDMSLVGPRPLLIDYLPYYSPKEKIRHSVRPGLTGWAQVNGRNAIDWDKKLELDVWYVENQNFYLDLKILFKTVLKVLKRSDINHSEEVLMPRFDEYVKKNRKINY